MVVPGGACMVALGGVWLLQGGGMCGCSGGACMVALGGGVGALGVVYGCSWGRGACMVAPGACVGYKEIWRYGQ